MFDPSKNVNGILPKSDLSKFKRGTGVGDFLQLYQDPTTLGFKLFFFNIGDISNKKKPNEVPNIAPPVYSQSSNSAGSNEGTQVDNATISNSYGLFGNEKNPNSALYYLNSIGDSARFNMLVDFKKLLSKLNTDFPWYFQSIEGLTEAWQRDYSKPKFKKEITINCLESIDLRITALMDLYRKIAYDWNNRRAILPDNLRKFDMTIKVYDTRNFQKDPGLYISNNNITKSKLKENSELLGENYSVTNQVSFDLKHCEFLPDESGAMFGTVSNSSYENASQVIKFSYENIEENNIYRSLVALGNSNHYYVRDYLQKELDIIQSSYSQSELGNLRNDNINDIFSSPNNPNFKEQLENEANNTINKIEKIDLKKELGGVFDELKTNISSQAANAVKSKLNSLYLGNVYGFSPSSLVGSARNRAVNAPANAVKNLGNAFGKGKN